MQNAKHAKLTTGFLLGKFLEEATGHCFKAIAFCSIVLPIVMEICFGCKNVLVEGKCRLVGRGPLPDTAYLKAIPHPSCCSLLLGF